MVNMARNFDPKAAGSLVATIQFRATGKEPGNYYLHIENGKCNFKEGNAESPTVAINGPSEVLIAISTGDMDGAQAFIQGKLRVEGDFRLLVKMGELFKRG